jgi:pimeloyl-ACP methyl ester carboxylesterase
VSTQTGSASAEGTQLHYEVSGDGPAVVLLHGRGLDLRMWAPQVAAFETSHRVVRYDLRGFGRSRSGKVPYTHADDLVRLLDHLGIDRAALVGCSLGGGAAVNFAVLHPDRLLALVPVGSSLGGYAWSPAFHETFRETQRIALESGPRAANAYFRRSPLFSTTHRNPALEVRLRELMRGDDGAHWTAPDLGRPLVPPAIERLGNVTAPALVVVGEHDVPDIQRIADVLTERIANARKVVLPGLGHLPSLEDPERFNQVVLEFLDGPPA